jgi:hypothetical protein
MICSFCPEIARPTASLCVFLMFLLTTTASLAQMRAPVPPVEKQKELFRLLEDGYDLPRLDSTAKKQDVFAKLVESSADENMGDDERYVVLTTAISLASQMGDAEGWLKAVNALVEAFEVDVTKEKTRLLTEFLKTSKPNAKVKPVVEEAISISQTASKERQFTEALSLLSSVDTVLRRAADGAALKPLTVEARAAIAAREKEWKAYQAAAAKLQTKPDDPVANLAVARWHLIQDDDWPKAIPLLVKASDAKWKTAAELEQAMPTDAMAQVAIGDAWWDIGQKETGTVKLALLTHAAQWYEQALPSLSSALKKQVVAKRIEELATPKSPSTQPIPSPVPVPSTTPKKTDWVDLLEWTEGSDWTGKGTNWNEQLAAPPQRTGIKLATGNSMKFPLSAIIDGNYEMEVVFTRHEGSGDVAIYFPVGIHTMRMLLCSDGGTVSRLDFINGKLGLTHAPGTFSNGQPHRVLIRVMHNDQTASIGVDFDEAKNYFKWDGPYTTLADVDQGRWRTTLLQHPWIGSFANANLVFQKVKVRMLSGMIVRDSITAADQEKDLKSDFVRLVGKKPLSAKALRNNFAINQFLAPPPELAQQWPRVSKDFKGRTDNQPIVKAVPAPFRDAQLCYEFIHADAPSTVSFAVPAGMSQFTAIGWATAGNSVKFEVWADGDRIYQSPKAGIAQIDVKLPTGTAKIELKIDDPGNKSDAHTFWCYPRLHRK